MGTLFVYSVLFLSFGWLVFCFVFSIRTLSRGFSSFDVYVDRNDNVGFEGECLIFLDLLDDARESLVIYDDGEDMAGSVYNRCEVIDVVQRKLDGDKDFMIRCFFDFDHDVYFRKMFGNHPRVDIRVGEKVVTGITHYKIIDDGRKVCLSSQRLGNAGNESRRVKWIDFTRVRRHYDYVVNEMVGMYREDFEQKFDVVNRLA